MKKIFSLLFLAAIFSLVSCGSTGRFVSQQDEIQLRGNPTTGYTWIYHIQDEEIISITEEIEYLGKHGIVGAPSLFHYTVTSKAPGETQISFEYERPWENKKPVETADYKVTVDKKGNIQVKEMDK